MSDIETLSSGIENRSEDTADAPAPAVGRLAGLLNRMIALLALAILLTVFWPVSRALFGPRPAPPIRLHDACDRALIRHTLPLAAPPSWQET